MSMKSPTFAVASFDPVPRSQVAELEWSLHRRSHRRIIEDDEHPATMPAPRRTAAPKVTPRTDNFRLSLAHDAMAPIRPNGPVAVSASPQPAARSTRLGGPDPLPAYTLALVESRELPTRA